MKYYKVFGAKVGHIWEPVLKHNFYFLCSTPEECARFIKKRFDYIVTLSEFNGKDGRCFFWENKKGKGGVCMLWVRSFTISTIVHEIGHSVYYALRHNHISRDEELFCYYAGYLASEIFKNKKFK